MENVITYEFAGHTATVIRPEHPNGKWIWKTEFLYAFDAAERALLAEGYTRVYYRLSDQYGCDRAVRQMHAFHRDVTGRFGLCREAILFGFSRGGLYAFRYALFYPEYVAKVYLDAPVLDMRTWPRPGTREYPEMLAACGLDEVTLREETAHPIGHLEEFFSLGIPLLVVAGGADEVVPFADNAGRLLAYAKEHGISVPSVVKPTCGHHPHSLEDVAPILDFVRK